MQRLIAVLMKMLAVILRGEHSTTDLNAYNYNEFEANLSYSRYCLKLRVRRRKACYISILELRTALWVLLADSMQTSAVATAGRS